MVDTLPDTKKTAKKALKAVDALGKNNLVGKKQRKEFKGLSNEAGDLGGDLSSLATGGLAQQGQAGAQTAADYAGATAGAGANLANNVFLPGAKSLYDMGMDPQNELYNRTLHQTQEQQRVGQAARGVEMSPFGAGLENDALKNFNLDWNDRQLDRGIKGAGAAGDLARSGFDLGNDSSKLAASGSLLPYSTAVGFKNDEMAGNDAQRTALERRANFGTTANQVPSQQISDWQSYLGMGPSYQGAATGQQTADTNTFSTIANFIPSILGKGG